MSRLINRLIDDYLEAALQRALDGSPLLLRCRRADTLDRLRAVAGQTLLLDTVEVPQSGSPEADLSEAVRTVDGRFPRISEIIADPLLSHVLFIVDGRDRSDRGWISIAGLWASTRRRHSTGPALCIIIHSGPPPAGCQALDDGALVGPAESLLLARSIRRDPPLLAEAADQVAIECACGNLPILTALLELPEVERFAPVRWLARQAEPPDPSTYWRGREAPDAIRLARSGSQALRARIWRGQMLILFPWIETCRELFITLQGSRIDAGLLDQDGQPLEVVDYEWGHIAAALKRQGQITAAQQANSIRELRNALAHAEPIDYQLAARSLMAGELLLSRKI